MKAKCKIQANPEDIFKTLEESIVRDISQYNVLPENFKVKEGFSYNKQIGASASNTMVTIEKFNPSEVYHASFNVDDNLYHTKYSIERIDDENSLVIYSEWVESKSILFKLNYYIAKFLLYFPKKKQTRNHLESLEKAVKERKKKGEFE